MCVISMVMDHYTDRFRPFIQPTTTPGWPAQPTGPLQPAIQPTTTWTLGPDLGEQIKELKALIAEFREAVAAARKVDALTGQPDCVDPQKAKLEERVAALEKELRGRRKRK